MGKSDRATRGMNRIAQAVRARADGIPREEPHPETQVFSNACKVCGGDIVQEFRLEFVGHGSPILGPGSRKQNAWVPRGLHCKECGIKYEFAKGVKGN